MVFDFDLQFFPLLSFLDNYVSALELMYAFCEFVASVWHAFNVDACSWPRSINKIEFENMVVAPRPDDGDRIYAQPQWPSRSTGTLTMSTWKTTNGPPCNLNEHTSTCRLMWVLFHCVFHRNKELI